MTSRRWTLWLSSPNVNVTCQMSLSNIWILESMQTASITLGGTTTIRIRIHIHISSARKTYVQSTIQHQLPNWHLNSSPGWQHSRKHSSQIHKDAKASKWRCENLRRSQETKRHKMKRSMGPQHGKKTKRLATHGLQDKWAEKRLAIATLFKHNYHNLPCRKRNQTGEMGGMGGERGKCLVALLLLLQTYSFSTLEKYI